jgi:hypothetical protein
MALNTQMSDTAVNAEANALAPLFNTGYLRIYTGTQPTNANTAIGAQTLLSTLRFGATAFPTAVAGVLTANAITSDTSAAATGTATWFRALQSDGTTVLMDGSVGTSAANLVLGTTTITAAQTVSCSSFVHTVNEATSGL